MHSIEEELGDKAQFAGKNFRNPLNWDHSSTFKTTYPSTVHLLIVQFEMWQYNRKQYVL